MGRVRRYKKLKSCDPFAKRRKSEVDEKYDQPPSDIEDDFEGDGQDDDLLFVSRTEDERRGGAVPFKGGGMPAAAAALWEARNGESGGGGHGGQGGPGRPGGSSSRSGSGSGSKDNTGGEEAVESKAKKRARKRAGGEGGDSGRARGALDQGRDLRRAGGAGARAAGGA